MDSHLKIKDEYMVCENCNEKSKLILPMEIKQVLEKFKGFELLHKNCLSKKNDKSK